MWKDYNVPEHCHEYIKSWKLHHPGWEYRFWTDDDLLKLITDNYSWFLKTYLNYKYNIQRSDAARHVLLHHYGGLYCDIDIECYKPTDDLFRHECVVFGENPTGATTAFGENPGGVKGIITNSIYYSSPGNKFMEICLKYLQIQRNNTKRDCEIVGEYVLRTTGCTFIDSMYHKWKHTMPIHRETHERFEYLSMTERQTLDKLPEPTPVEYGIHHSMNSWL